MSQARTRTSTSQSRMNAFLAICISVFILWAAYEVLMPIALAVLLAFLLAPIVTRLERFGLPQVWAVIATVTVAFGLIVGLGYAVGTQVYSLGELLQNQDTQKEIVRKATTIKRMLGGSGGIGDKIAEIGEQIDREAAKSTTQQATSLPADDAGVGGAIKEAAGNPVAAAAGTDAPLVATTKPAVEPAGTVERPYYTVALPAPPTPVELVGRYIGTVLGPLGTAGLVLVFTIFVLIEREQLRDRMISIISGGNYTNTTTAINDATTRISRYMLAQSIVNGSYGLIVGIGLWLIGVTLGGDQGFPSFVLWGLLCATLRFIPYIGPWAAAAFPIALSLAVFEGFNVFAATVAMFVAIELFSNNVMEPWLYGSSTGLSTVAILVAAVFWTWLWGPIGLLLSTPLTVCIVVLGRYTAQLHFLDTLLSDRPALPPPVRFYQRLLAADEREATAIVREVAAESDWSRAADAVVVPALSLVRRDRRDEHLTTEDEGRLLTAIRAVQEKVAERLGEEVPTPDAPADVPPDKPRVLAIPAHHRSEEAVLMWLPVGPVLDPVAVEVGSTRALAAHVIDRVERERPAAVVVGVVPPGGLIQARFLCRRLRRRVPDVPIIVAYFGRPRHFDRLLNRLRNAGAAYVTTSIEQTQRQILAVTISRPGAGAPTPVPDPMSVPDPTPAPGGEPA